MVQDGGITREEASRIAPLAPGEVAIRTARGAVIVSWRGTGGDLRAYRAYRVYRLRAPGTRQRRPVAVVPAEQGTDGRYEFRDAGTRPRTSYRYGVTAVDVRGTESAMTESAVVTVEWGHSGPGGVVDGRE